MIVTALTIILVIGIAGLVIDLARMYVARNEIQAFVDAATFGATMQLDGTDQGIQHARNLVSEYRTLDKWNFQTSAPQDVAVTFSNDSAGPYEANPVDPKRVKYVRVTARAPVTLYFLPGFSQTAPLGMMLFSIARTQTLRGVANAGQLPVTTFYENLLPYSPDGLNPADPNFGYSKGSMYTLRWPPKGLRPDPANPPNPGTPKWENWCQGDRAAGYVPISGAEERGFIDIGWGGYSGGSAYIRQAIVSSVQSHPMSIGDTIIQVNGNRGTESNALRERFSQDVDTVSTNSQQYLANRDDPMSPNPGNGRRFGIAPVNDPANDKVLGFGLFLLHSDVCGDPKDNTASCCAEYVGSVLVPDRAAAEPTGGAFKANLFK